MSEKRKITMDDALAAGDAVIMTARRLRIKELEEQNKELLEALEKIVELNAPGRVYELHQLGMLVYTMLSIARAAIAKAKGEEKC